MHRLALAIALLSPLVTLTACGGAVRGEHLTGGAEASATAGTTGLDGGGSTGNSGGSGSSGTTAMGETSAGSGGTVSFDVPADTGGGETAGPAPSCKVVDDMNGVGQCGDKAPPDSFEPALQWTWTPESDIYSIVTPLVANLTDDNGDGAIDLCDTPDILVVATAELQNEQPPGYLYVLDGATGAEHARFETPVDASGTPGIADFDRDGTPEIVTATGDGQLVMFDPTGTVLWHSTPFQPTYFPSAVALADVDHDGDVEIAYGDMLFDHAGILLWDSGTLTIVSDAPAIANLDGEGTQEIVLGNRALRADGSVYYDLPALAPGFPAVANLDEDLDPEIILTNEFGITVLEHDGSIKLQDLRPTGDPADGLNWARPATVHDFDGDGQSEFAVSSSYHYSVYNRDVSLVWSAQILDDSGIAAGTAFDFLGDGEAEAMYADEYSMYIYDGAGVPVLQVPRMSRTLIEYPVVADVDNDGSAEIVVVSNETTNNESGSPTVQVIRDQGDRWIQARRIWNQHTYHVTNVREDAIIPQDEAPHWQQLNTFRTNAQIEGGLLCKPPPAG